jgi:hypothetical protein
VPAGTGASVSARLTDDPSDLAVFKFYTVKRGETLPSSRASCTSARTTWRKPIICRRWRASPPDRS